MFKAVLVASMFSVVALAQTPPGPPPIPPVLSVTPMGLVQQNKVIQCRDGTYSALINGSSYWIFGDTALTKYNAEGQNFFDNSLSWATSLNAKNGISLNKDQNDSSGLPTRVIPWTAAEENYNYTHQNPHCTAKPCGNNLALWPGPITYDPASGHVIVAFNEILRGPNISTWESVGEGLAVGNVRANGTIVLTRPLQGTSATYPTLMWTGKQYGFTDQAFVYNGYYYAYGSHPVWVVTEVQLARVPVAQVLNISAWQYYAGKGNWTSNPADAVTVFDGGAAGSSVFYNTALGVWMAIFSQNYSDDLYYAVAYQPEGPWSASTLLLSGLAGYQGNFDYAGRAHPEFSPDGGFTQYVSYVQDTGFLAQDLPLNKVVFGPVP